jgi:thiamine transporter
MQEKSLSKRREYVRKMVECALLVAVAVAIDLIPFPKWPQGGSVSLCMIPIVFCSYRNGAKWGLAAGFVLSCVQMIMGFYVPPANTVWAIILCVLLDYVIAFTALGSADIFAKLCGRFRTVGYAAGAVAAGVIRFICSFLSGVILWDSYTPEGMSAWWYSLTYNGSYMLPNTVIAAVAVTLLCGLIDPKTLKPIKK